MTDAPKIPVHVAIIMDGNGRWAKARGLSRIKGHEEGAESVRAVLRACRQNNVKYLTLYAFSVENWSRPRHEIEALMAMLERFLRKQEYELHENKVRLRAMGRLDDLPSSTRKELDRVMQTTVHYTEGQLILALSYGARQEIAAACRKIAEEVKKGLTDPAKIDESFIAKHLYLPDVPDPDLLIRTSGELRISNFMLWQASYTEFYFTEILWPDFREKQLKEAIDEYGRRQRRFGNIG
jgi:undecaprenyl diphosphate synthase